MKKNLTPPSQPLILDIAGLTLSAADRRHLAHPLVGGMILFGRNWSSRDQLLQLCADIKTVREDLLILVDHEGGKVQRFRTDGFTHLPPMAALGAFWMDDAMAATNAASACGYVLASELRACGVDMSFAPVLDLDYGRSTVMGDRAFHRDPRVVSMLGRALMQGMAQAGMANCGKHFPGHGHVVADSHLEIPVDSRDLENILGEDAMPYAWLSSVLDSLMPAHVIYSKVDDVPAGFSRRWLRDILRAQLGFGGAIFSDDLSMEGARYLRGQALSFSQATVHALEAGCDMVLLCNQSTVEAGKPLDNWLHTVNALYQAGNLPLDEASQARRMALISPIPPLDWDTLMTHPRYLHALDIMEAVYRYAPAPLTKK